MRSAPFALLALSGAALALPQGPDVVPPQVLVPPEIRQNPTRWVPLSALISLTTDEPTQVILDIDDGSRQWEVIAEPNFHTVHDVPVLGMRAGLTHSIVVTVVDAVGNATVVPGALVFDTLPFPNGFPPLQATLSNPPLMQPGVTLLTASYSTVGGGPTGSYILMLDDHGEVVWYYRNPLESPSNVELLRSGNLMFGSNRAAVEIDRLGNVVGRWYPGGWTTAGITPDAILVDTDSFHHETYELPESEEADFLALSTEMRVLPNYPASETDTSTTNPTARVVGDVIVEFKRDGTIVRETKLLDILDPYRLCYNSLQGFYDNLYGAPSHDWTHGNSARYIPSDDTYLVSLRHQDAVVRIQRQTGQLLWILGDHARWNPPWSNYLLTPIGSPFAWQYHQHSPDLNPIGNVVLFDNGNYRVIPPTPAGPQTSWYSRSVEYRVDPLAMTVQQVWVYGGPNGGWFSGFLGDADPLIAKRTVLVTDGAKPSFGNNSTYARVAEVTRSRPPVVVFEALIEDQTHQLNWTVYRSERIPGVYPE